MDRSLHFSLSVLKKIRHLPSSDWRKWIITSCPKSISSIYIDTKELVSILNGQIINDEGTILSVIKKYYRPTKEQYSILTNGGKCDDEILNGLHDLYELCECIGSDRFLYTKDVDPRLYYNSAFIRNTREDSYYQLRNKGIEVCDINSELGIKELTANWFEPSDPEGEENYNWSHFLRHPLPPSNSVVIVDRYLFGSGGC